MKAPDWICAALCAAWCIALAAVGGAAWVEALAPLEAGSKADWISAWGTVAAIIASGGIATAVSAAEAHRQRQHRDSDQTARERGELIAFFNAANLAVSTMEQAFSDEVVNWNSAQFDVANALLTQARVSLGAVQISLLPTMRLADHHGALMLRVNSLQVQLSGLREMAVSDRRIQPSPWPASNRLILDHIRDQMAGYITMRDLLTMEGYGMAVHEKRADE